MTIHGFKLPAYSHREQTFCDWCGLIFQICWSTVKKWSHIFKRNVNSCVARVQSENSVINSRFCSYWWLFPFLGSSSWINSYIQDLFLDVFWLISLEGNFFWQMVFWFLSREKSSIKQTEVNTSEIYATSNFWQKVSILILDVLNSEAHWTLIWCALSHSLL